MPKLDLNISKSVFNDAYFPYLENMAQTQIYYGGGSSGKSVFLAQRMIIDLLKGGRNFVVCRAVGSTLRKSVWVEVKKWISAWSLSHLFRFYESNMVIICLHNRYQAVFTGLDDTEKLKSLVPEIGAFTDVWVEEATETIQDAIYQLEIRMRGGDESTPKRLVMSFNPILKSHWIYKTYFSPIEWGDDQTEYISPNLTILKTWHEHNKFLTRQDINKLITHPDPYWRAVYGFGEWGTLGNLVFNNWRTEDLTGRHDEFTNIRNGLDFGYAEDPSAAVRTHYDAKRKRIYIFQELYEFGSQINALADVLRPVIGTDYVAADSSEPRAIEELRTLGIRAFPAKKGKDSVLYGIQWLQQHEIIICKTCIRTRQEFEQYHWIETKSGETTNRPIDKYNHAIDALRYAYEAEALRENRDRILWTI